MASIRCPNCSHQLDVPGVSAATSPTGAASTAAALASPASAMTVNSAPDTASDSSSTSVSLSTSSGSTLQQRTRTPPDATVVKRRPLLMPPLLSRSTSDNGVICTTNDDEYRHTSYSDDVYANLHGNATLRHHNTNSIQQHARLGLHGNGRGFVSDGSHYRRLNARARTMSEHYDYQEFEEQDPETYHVIQDPGTSRSYPTSEQIHQEHSTHRRPKTPVCDRSPDDDYRQQLDHYRNHRDLYRTQSEYYRDPPDCSREQRYSYRDPPDHYPDSPNICVQTNNVSRVRHKTTTTVSSSVNGRTRATSHQDHHHHHHKHHHHPSVTGNGRVVSCVSSSGSGDSGGSPNSGGGAHGANGGPPATGNCISSSGSIRRNGYIHHHHHHHPHHYLHHPSHRPSSSYDVCDDYDDVFDSDHDTSSSSCDQKPLNPVLSHIDFWPSVLVEEDLLNDCVFEEFDVLLERANRWTKQFPLYDVISCETVGKKVRDVHEIYSAAMEYTDEEHTMPDAAYIRGLRLWYRQRTKASRPRPVVICSFDTQPKLLQATPKNPKFETISNVIDRVNAKLKEHPLQGEILSVESVCMKIPEQDWSVSMSVNTLSCQAPDEYHCHQMTFIRLFYILGQITHCTVGVKDFVPHVIDAGGIFHPAHYAPLFSLVSSARAWLSENRDIKLVTIQTLETKHRKKSENQGNRFNTEPMFEYKIDERFRAYYIRVSYTMPVKVTPGVTLNPVTHLTCRTFQPLAKGDGERENITEVIARIEKFLIRIGSRPVYIESQAIPEWMTREEFHEQGDRTFFDGDWYFRSDKDGNPRGPYRHPLLNILRVYYDGQFDDPSCSQLTAMRAMSAMPPECCRIS